MVFVDKVKLKLQAGKGGNGVVAWFRAAYIPKGGPTGGNGGPGGDIIIEADEHIYSLEYYRDRCQMAAGGGAHGGSNQRQGGRGKHLVLKVPCGTLVKEASTGVILADLTHHKEKWIACRGGKGGRGNYSFRSSTRQAPNFATPGRDGEALDVELELKLIADVGLVGFPNAGKSTLISSLANVRVKTASYPFTTLYPNLGYLRLDNGERLLVADIPGIIEGAHQDKGLGLSFLRHIERTDLLVFVLDASGIDGRDPYSDYEILCKELAAYSPTLLQKPSVVVLNKSDTEEAQEHLAAFKTRYRGTAPYTILSAYAGDGLETFIQLLVDQIDLQRAQKSTLAAI